MEEVFAYTLVDPIDGAVRYIGISNSPEKRYKQHCNPKGNGAACIMKWIEVLRKKGLAPRLFVIEGGLTWDNACKREAYWIDFYLSEEEPLLNYVSPTRRRDQSPIPYYWR